jgi:lipoprotein-releasing system ATP-binding protein
MKETVVEARGVVKRFDLDGRTLPILNGIDLSVAKGETLGIVGASGAGKSTLLHILGALDRPTEGSVHYGDVDVFSLPEGERAAYRGRRVGFVFQNHMLLPEFTACENVALAAMILGRSRPEAMDRGAKLLNRVGLGERLSHRPGKLSGGEQQRVALARALVNDPDLVLADEPTGNLDTKTGDAVFELIHGLNADRNQTFVIVTHNRDLADRMDRVVTMTDGVVR